MNIQELHNRLVKRANITKVAGPGADKLRKIIADINKVRGDKNLGSSLHKITHHPDAPDSLSTKLMPYTIRNKILSVPLDLEDLKSSNILYDADLNGLIDRIIKKVTYRKRRIRDLGGDAAAYAFDQSLINKYIKDVNK